MLFSFLQKQKDIKKRKKLIETMILSLKISSEQQQLYIQALEVLTSEEAQELFTKMTQFVEKIEIREIEKIRKESFWNISGMRKKEIEEKTQDMNSFSFLLHNL